jgi:putative ubiquitin-RnfH superfamily antitoxin RatB of RatAB toxin-antitoxin module
MAQIIKLKRSTTPGSVPTTSDLSIAELAINVSDGKVFLRKSGSAVGDVVQELVSNNYEGDVDISGSVTASYFVGDGSQLTNITVDQAATVKRSFTAQSTWVVNHNLDTENAIVQAYNNDNYQIIPQSVQLTDANTVTISFPTQESGYVVVAKGGHVVSGSIDAANIDGLDLAVKTKLNTEGVFSGSAQVTMTGDVTGTAAATVISQIDGGSI